MKIVQSNAISLNGMIARENGEEDWLPAEGWDEFIEDVKQFGNIIMGRETYERVTELYPNYNFDSVEAQYKVIVTSQTSYEAPAGYIAVSSPEAAKNLLAKAGIKVGLLIGGGKLNGSFYVRGLVDEVWITINPIILGKGRPFISSEDIEISLRLKEVIQLSKDRVQLRYSVLKSLE